MTNPQAPFQTEQPATQHTEALVRAEGMLGTVELHGGSLITIDHEGVAALAAKTRHVEIPVTAIVDVVDQADNHGERPSGSGRPYHRRR